MSDELLRALYESPKEVLNRGFCATERIAWRQERIEELRRIATSISVAADGSGSGAKGFPRSKIEQAVVQIIGMQDEILAEIENLVRYEHETREIIATYVVNPTYAAVLELRYCNQCTWEEIADRLHYSVDWVQKLHGRALYTLKEDVKVYINLN